MKKQDPPIEREMHLALEDLFHGCTKKIKISRRVSCFDIVVLIDRSTSLVRSVFFILILRDTFFKTKRRLFIQVMNEDGQTSSIKDKILTITVKPGWKEGTRITFPKEGDQVTDCSFVCASDPVK